MANILSVENDKFSSEHIQSALTNLGHQITTVATGGEALRTYGNGSGWDLLILDHEPNHLDAIHLFKDIQKVQPSAKAIILSSQAGLDLAHEAIKAGVMDILRTPFTSDSLCFAVSSALDRTPQKVAGVSAEKLMSILGRTTINGFSSTVVNAHCDEVTHTWEIHFEVSSPDGTRSEFLVEVPVHTIELAKAYADCEKVPGNQKFWVAMAEEALAAHLLTEASIPESRKLVVNDLTRSLRRWLDAVLTVG